MALRQALSLVGSDRRWRWWLLVVIAVVISGMEAVGAILIYTLMGLIASPEAAVTLPVIGDVRELFPDVDRVPFLVGTALTVGVFFIIRGVAAVAQAYVQHRIVQNAGADLANRLVRGYVELPYLYHTRQNSSMIVRNVFESVRLFINHVAMPAVYLFSSLLIVVGMLVVVAWASPWTTLLAVAVILPLVGVLLRIVQPRLKALGRRTQDLQASSLKALQQAIGGIRDIRILGREQHFARVFATERSALARTEYLRGTFSEVPRALIQTTMILIIVAIFITAITAGGDVESLLSTLGLFAYISLQLQPNLRAIVGSLNSLKYGTAVLDDLVADHELATEAYAQMKARRRDRGEGSEAGFARSIELQGVTFAYSGDGPPAVREVDLTIRRGEFLGVCGPTGGGKSTLVDLIVGLLEPDTGEVLVDDAPLGDDPAWWYRQLGVVSQSVFLVDDTLRRNIAFGLKDRDIDEERLRRAIERAQLVDVVEGMPEGLETVIGERGIRLSGGQRQRVSIARALYNEPQVLVFDEGTSALDTATERALVAAVDELRAGRTLITVAHRLSTVRNADRIIVVGNGRVSAEGTYDQLMETSDLFRTLAR